MDGSSRWPEIASAYYPPNGRPTTSRLNRAFSLTLHRTSHPLKRYIDDGSIRAGFCPPFMTMLRVDVRAALFNLLKTP
jgi:hypothetical protein